MTKYYITTAIVYTSRIPHIGNTYEAVLADAIARYKRLAGYDVFFLTGTDEHGQKIQKQAQDAGMEPKAYVNKIAAEIKDIWDMMNVSYDKFIRTTDKNHEKAVAAIFKKLYEQDDIYKSTYSGNYCVACESFFTDAQLDDENRCPDCGGPVEVTSEEAYFLRLSKYADRLAKHIEDNPDFIQPKARRNEMVNNFIKAGLSDLCVSRSTFKWGVPVDFDPGHVVYVWIDALSNYITALDYMPDGAGGLYKRYWPADLHLIGKDILRFHTIYWPIVLMALGEPLPKMVFGHPWLLISGEKMSKSKGNTIYAKELVDKFGVDAIRYFLLSEMPFSSDGTLTYELVASRYNSDLANILGNLVNRTLAMTNKYFNGIVPKALELNDTDKDLIATAKNTAEQMNKYMDALRVSDAIYEVFTLLRRSNKYIDETTPWLLARDDEGKKRLQTVLYNLLEAIRISAVMLQPFLPETSEKILTMLGKPQNSFESIKTFGALESGINLGSSTMLFARVDEAAVVAALEEAKAKENGETEEEAKEEYLPISPEIKIDDFARIDLRAAKVTACERVKKSDKLLLLTLDLGFETRQVVSGIAKTYAPEELVGRTVALIANLAPAKIRGVESQGMILASGEDDSKLTVIFLDGAKIGAKIR